MEELADKQLNVAQAIRFFHESLETSCQKEKMLFTGFSFKDNFLREPKLGKKMSQT